MLNHILDVPGLSVGNASDPRARSGSTVVVFDVPATVGVAVHGGAPGTRETDALSPTGLGPPVDAVVLTGGSAFGLAAADGAMLSLARRGRGFAVGPHRVPIVPAAVVFDLTGPRADYRALGEAAVEAAFAAPDASLGTVGAGTNAMTAGLKGGLGSASTRIGDVTVGALVVANAIGSVTAADGPWFRATPFEVDGEFGGLAWPPHADFASVRSKHSANLRGNTVIALVATDAVLGRGDATHVARIAHDGIALSVWPAHTRFDGDTIFVASTGRVPMPVDPSAIIAINAAAAATVARALTRAVYAATAVDGDRFPTWRERFGDGSLA